MKDTIKAILFLGLILLLILSVIIRAGCIAYYRGYNQGVRDAFSLYNKKD